MLQARWPASLLAAAFSSMLLAGCGNKGELYLPGSIDDERVLQDIDEALDAPLEPLTERERRAREAAAAADSSEPDAPEDPS